MNLKPKIYFRLSLYCLLFTFYFLPFTVPSSLLSQTQEQMREQAKSTLQRMTPEEIDRKLKELGITREEAIRRAAELNINLEDYLSKPQTTSVAPGGVSTQAVVPAPTQTPIIRVEVPIEKKGADVPGFTGRPGVGNLRPFGYDLFQYPASTFEPVLNVPTPVSYPLGPADEIVISVWGETKLYYALAVNREGNVVVPDVGPVGASGQTVQQFRERLLRRMTAIYSGLKNGAPNANTFLDVSLGKIRTIQVFVLGEVVKPGGYALSSLSTAFHALYLSAGSTVNGTLREVQIIRDNKALPMTDFYDFILRGSRSSDIRLQDGDMIFVKPALKRAALAGNVVRPAIYELRGNESLGDLIKLSGGLRFDGYFNRVHLERIIPFEQRKLYNKDVLDIDLHFESLENLHKSTYALENGDVVTILKVSDLPENRVTVAGSVKKPGTFELTPGMRVRDLILKADSLERNTFSERGTLLRLLPNLKKEIIAFNPRLALADDEKNNILLKNEDVIEVYKESQFFPEHMVTVGGAVRKPGPYTRNAGMTAGDLVVLAGGLKEEGLTNGWEISRIDTSKLGVYSKVFKIDMPKEYWAGHSSEPFYLKDFDQVFVPSDPKYSLPKMVQVSGYAMYPGPYAIQNEQEKLADILKRAGGLKPGAYLEGSVIIRKQNNAGLIPIEFKKALDDPTSRDNVGMVDGDSINIALHDDIVYVRGEVFVPSAVLYEKGAGLSFYLSQAGGLRDEADEAKVVVFLPGGKKWEPSVYRILDPDILPGSTIIVPRKVEKEDKTLPVLRDLATILASLAAITVALIQVSK